ncbi:MAG: penicillin-binding protein [Lactobacillales bacterium]|jgi:penicillin-binding protein 1A|nr:penicillin-binding protein [Lactobacillales bacterium]
MDKKNPELDTAVIEQQAKTSRAARTLLEQKKGKSAAKPAVKPAPSAAKKPATRVAKNAENADGKKGKKTKKKKRFRALKITILVLFLLGLAGVGTVAAVIVHIASEAPELDLNKFHDVEASEYFTLAGEDLGTRGGEKRQELTPKEVPNNIKKAIVAVEDRRFYKHKGIDPVRIIGATINNVKNKLTHRVTNDQGGSTLTQQLIKLTFFSTESKDRTYKRKIQEWWLAIQLEQKKTKAEILTMYINKVFEGEGYYGMATAAKGYYDKEIKDLTTPQLAVIVGLANGPSAYDPLVHPLAATGRRDVALLMMYEGGMISKKEYKEAKATPITDGLRAPEEGVSEQQVRVDNYMQGVVKQFVAETGLDPATAGAKIYTNLNMDVENHMWDVVNGDELVKYPPTQTYFENGQPYDLQVAATLIDVKTGNVVAQIGGRHMPAVLNGLNRAVSTDRDFGSSMKPIMDYGPAIEYKKWTTGHSIVDQPYKYKGTDISVYNWDNKYMGAMTIREALVQSRNVPAVETYMEVGGDSSAKFAKGLGIEFSSVDAHHAISSNDGKSVGSDGKYGSSTLKQAAAYAAFANEGIYHEPSYISKIVFRDGTTKVINHKPFKAMESGTAYMITDMLKGIVTRHMSNQVEMPGIPQAGKTGTSNYTDEQRTLVRQHYASAYAGGGITSPDVAFIGYNPQYALAVWCGYDAILIPVGSKYHEIPSQIYKAIMQGVVGGQTMEDWTMPDNVYRSGSQLFWRGSKDATAPASYSTTTTTSTTTTSSSSSFHTPSSSTTPATTPSSSSEETTPPPTSSEAPATEPPTSSSEAGQ